MFPQLRQRIGPALDVIVEFSTLGEYRLGADGVVYPASALAPAPEHVPQLGGAGDSPVVAQAAVRHLVAAGTVGAMPAATPAARRALKAKAPRPHVTAKAPRPHAMTKNPRPHVIARHEQLCLAV